jgi:ribosomal protein L11 methyltransferase
VREFTDRDPVFVGVRFVVVPVGQAETQRRLSPDRIVLPIDAAVAFGSGRHESTQLCLLALEMVLKPGDSGFDVGCGSGILALAARELGAACVVGVDIDETAIGVARRHFAGSLFVGSANSFRAAAADLVISNITEKVNDRIAGELQRIAKPAGRIVISGFTAQTPPRNFTPEYMLSQGDWQCWICSPAFIQPRGEHTPPDEHEGRWWM